MIVPEKVIKKIKAYDAIGQSGITVEAGDKVYDLVHPELLAGHSVELSFEGVRHFSAPFLNQAIGRLLADIEPDEFDRLFKVTHPGVLDPDDYNVVIEDAKEYFGDPEFARRVDELLLKQSTDWPLNGYPF